MTLQWGCVLMSAGMGFLGFCLGSLIRWGMDRPTVVHEEPKPKPKEKPAVRRRGINGR
jgi:hypothetical protein